MLPSKAASNLPRMNPPPPPPRQPRLQLPRLRMVSAPPFRYILASFNKRICLCVSEVTASLNKKIQDLEKQVEELQRSQATLIKELASSEDAEEQKDEEIASLKASLKEATAQASLPNGNHAAELDTLHEEIKTLKTSMQAAEDARTFAEKELKAGQEKAEEHQQTITDQSKAISSLKTDLQSDQEKLQGVLSQLQVREGLFSFS